MKPLHFRPSAKIEQKYGLLRPWPLIIYSARRFLFRAMEAV